MKRGEVWTLQDKNYASKSRPVVVIQSDKYDAFESIILCLFTSFESDNISTRVRIEPSADNGLHKSSYVMTDKIVTVNKSLLGSRIGRLSDEDMKAVSEQLKAILDL